MIDYSPMLFPRDGDIFKPLAGSIRVAFGPYGSGLLYPAMKDIYDKTKAGAFLWQDRNNDQSVQEDELTVSPTGRGETAFNWIDGDLNAGAMPGSSSGRCASRRMADPSTTLGNANRFPLPTTTRTTLLPRRQRVRIIELLNPIPNRPVTNVPLRRSPAFPKKPGF